MARYCDKIGCGKKANRFALFVADQIEDDYPLVEYDLCDEHLEFARRKIAQWVKKPMKDGDH